MDKSPKPFYRIIDTEHKCKKAIEIYYWWPSKHWNQPTERDKIINLDIIPQCPFHKINEHKKYTLDIANQANDYKFKQFRCKKNRQSSFNVLTGTIFFSRRIPVKKWFEAYWYYRKTKWRDKIKEVTKKLDIDKRTLKNMFLKFDNLPRKQKNLLYDIKNKYAVYLEILNRKEYERGEKTKSDTRQIHLQKKNTKVLSDTEVIKEFNGEFNQGYLEALLRLRKGIEDVRKKGTEEDE